MSDTSRAKLPNVFPIISYKEAPAAIEWLVNTFGFEKRMVLPAPDGAISHAELGLGAGTVMLNSVKNGADGASNPRDQQAVYIALDDVDAHYARAKSAGAEILQEPFDTDYGSRDYAARDLEGHVWYFGTYLPGA
jgi:uncharacterized glyoxalase superfamily protein PhnB